MIYAFFLFVFVQKSFLTKTFFLYVEINLTTRGPLYTCLVNCIFQETSESQTVTNEILNRFDTHILQTLLQGIFTKYKCMFLCPFWRGVCNSFKKCHSFLFRSLDFSLCFNRDKDISFKKFLESYSTHLSQYSQDLSRDFSNYLLHVREFQINHQ